MMIFSYIPTRLDSVEIEDIENKIGTIVIENYSDHYYQLNTDKFRYNENLNLNIDPYKEMKVFIIDENKLSLITYTNLGYLEMTENLVLSVKKNAPV